MLQPIYPPFWDCMIQSDDGILYVPTRIKPKRYAPLLHAWAEHFSPPLLCGSCVVIHYSGPDKLWADAVHSKLFEDGQGPPPPFVYPECAAETLDKLLPAADLAIVYPGVSQLVTLRPQALFIEREMGWIQVLRGLHVPLVEGDLACLTPLRTANVFVDLTRPWRPFEGTRTLRLAAGWASKWVHVLSSELQPPTVALLGVRKIRDVRCEAVTAPDDSGSMFTYLWSVRV